MNLTSRRRRRVVQRIMIVLGVPALAPAARAQATDCPMTIARTAPADLEGAYVRTVGVHTDAPVALPVLAGPLASLRRTTETAVVQRQLLFGPGDRLDTVAVGETLRRLRDQRLYADVALRIARCAGSDTVDLVVLTRDAWTLLPVARVVPPSLVSLGVEDRNVLGTGRSISVTNDQTARGHGGAIAASDPFLFGANLIGAFRFSDVGGNHLLRAALRHHELSVLDEWRGELAVGRQTYSDFRADEHAVGNFYLVANVGHRLGSSRASVTVPYIGVEVDSGEVVTMARGDPSPSFHTRRFIGGELGLLRRAAIFDTVSWLTPHSGFVDVPVGLEHDVLIAPGLDRGQHAGAVHYDAWLGRIWIPIRGRVLSADAWTSGYLGNVRANHVDRLSLSEYNDAARGFWGGRLMLEQLLAVDPDLHGVTLATINADPTFSAVPKVFRTANRSAFGSLERALHIAPIGRGSWLDAGVFGAASVRWDARDASARGFEVGVVGARIRLLTATGVVSSTRIDLTWPVQASGPVVRRPLVSVSVGSLFDVLRMRDGRRRQQ